MRLQALGHVIDHFFLGQVLIGVIFMETQPLHDLNAQVARTIVCHQEVDGVLDPLHLLGMPFITTVMQICEVAKGSRVSGEGLGIERWSWGLGRAAGKDIDIPDSSAKRFPHTKAPTMKRRMKPTRSEELSAEMSP